jgi:Tfp pilus assembly protein PilN
MIKIDLGRDAEQRAKAKKKPQAQPILNSKRTASLPLANLGGTVLVVGALAFAFLPYLFVEQHKKTTREKHEQAKVSLQEAKAEAQREIDKYSSYKQELESFEKQSALIRERLNAVNNLLSSRNGVVNLLDAIGQGIPGRAWLTRLDLKNGSQPSIQFAGGAYSNEDVTDFSDKLSASVYLEKVTLEEVSATKTSGKGEDTRNFSFRAVPKIFLLKDESREAASQPNK